ncbi:MAG: hypothetical protein ACRDE7_07400 [Sphingobacterium sp.]
MEQTIKARHITIVKSIENKKNGLFTEHVYKVCLDDLEVLRAMRDIEKEYKENEEFEILHGLTEWLSLGFRNNRTGAEVRFRADGWPLE